MPLHRIYTEPGLFSAADKRALSTAITQYYNQGPGQLPKFYVIVIFHEIPNDSFFIGDQSYDERKQAHGKPFVRILSQHVARAVHGAKNRSAMTDRLELVFKPFIADRGFSWEFNIEESAGDLARNEGYPLPAPGSEAEKQWREADTPSIFDGPTISDYLASKEKQLSQ